MRRQSVKRLRNSFRVKLGRYAAAFAAVAVLLVIILLFYIMSNIGAMVVRIAVAEVTDVITLAVNDVIADKVMSGEVDYSDLVSLEKDSEGNITALVTNMANVNYLQAEITRAITARFKETQVTTVKIPLGNLIGGTMFSGKGPAISVDILSVSNVNSNFRNEFSSAGINQTKHRIVLEVEVSLGILLAGYSDSMESVVTDVTVAETVIVGSVPNAYASFG